MRKSWPHYDKRYHLISSTTSRVIGDTAITGFLSVLKPDVSPTRQISILKIPAIFDLNRSIQGFDKVGVADVSFRCPNRVCKKSCHRMK